MKGCPFEYQRHGSPREFSPENGERFYLNKGLVFTIFGMEMRRTVIAKVHSNHNPEESSYLRHYFLRFYPVRRAAQIVCNRFAGPGRVGIRSMYIHMPMGE